MENLIFAQCEVWQNYIKCKLVYWRANKITGYYFKRIVSRKRVYPISKKYFEPNQTSMMELFAEKVIKVHHRCWTRFHEQLCISFNLSFSESKPYFDSLSRHKGKN